MADELSPEQIRQIKDLIRDEAPVVVRHELANLNIGTAEGDARQRTQRNVWTLWEIAEEYRKDTSSAVRKWLFDRYVEWELPESRKQREHIANSMAAAERRRESMGKAIWGILGAIGVAVVLAVISHAGTIFSGLGAVGR